MVLEMMDYTSRSAGLSIADAYVEASATASLSERENDIIKAYLARRMLIEAFSKQTIDEEWHHCSLRRVPRTGLSLVYCKVLQNRT